MTYRLAKCPACGRSGLIGEVKCGGEPIRGHEILDEDVMELAGGHLHFKCRRCGFEWHDGEHEEKLNNG